MAEPPPFCGKKLKKAGMSPYIKAYIENNAQVFAGTADNGTGGV
jgi:hypothetical protein